MVNTVNSLNTTWTAGLNGRFAGKPAEAMKRLLGVLDVNPPAWKRPAVKVREQNNTKRGVLASNQSIYSLLFFFFLFFFSLRFTLALISLPSLSRSIPVNNGPTALPLPRFAISLTAAHAGRSEPSRLHRTVSVSAPREQSTRTCPLRIWSAAAHHADTGATEVIRPLPGPTSLPPVPSLEVTTAMRLGARLIRSPTANTTTTTPLTLLAVPLSTRLPLAPPHATQAPLTRLLLQAISTSSLLLTLSPRIRFRCNRRFS